MFVELPKVRHDGTVKMTMVNATEVKGFEPTTLANGKTGTKVYAAAGQFKVAVEPLVLGAGLVKALANKELVSLAEGTTVPMLMKQGQLKALKA